MSSILSPEKEKTYLAVARKAALAAGKIQMAHFGHTVKVHTKATSIDLVTSVDEESDRTITALLLDAFPDDRIVSEESCQEPESGHFNLCRAWVVDPLDGTTNYAHGFPQFAVSIAYFGEDCQPELGVVYDPFKKEMFYALRGRGAFLNEQPIHVSQTQRLSQALLATGFPYDLADTDNNNISHFQRILPHCHGVRRPGAAALDLTYLACGRLDAFWELRLSPWDIAAGALIIEEAGGRVTDLDGNPLDLSQRRLDLIGSNGNGLLHEELTALLLQENAQRR